MATAFVALAVCRWPRRKADRSRGAVDPPSASGGVDPPVLAFALRLGWRRSARACIRGTRVRNDEGDARLYRTQQRDAEVPDAKRVRHGVLVLVLSHAYAAMLPGTKALTPSTSAPWPKQ